MSSGGEAEPAEKDVIQFPDRHVERPDLKAIGAPDQDAAGAVVVVGVDGTTASLHALRQASVILRAVGGRVVVVFARKPPIVAGADLESAVAVNTLLEAQDDIRVAAERDALAVCREAGIPVEFVECDGDPGRSIVDVAHKVDASCVVVGATIHGAVSSLFLSSVAEYLLHHCDLSLVIVRPDQPEGE